MLEVLIGLVTRADVEVLGLPTDVTLVALARARQSPAVPLSDALIVAMAREAGATSVATLDRGMGSHGIDVIAP